MSVDHIAIEIMLGPWTGLLLIGAGNGLFLSSALLLTNSDRNVSRYLLAGLALVSTLHVIPYLALATGAVLEFPHLLRSTLPIAWAGPPLYYLYARTLLNPSRGLRLLDTLHFIPMVYRFVDSIPFYRLSAEVKRAGAEYLMSTSEIPVPFADTLVVAVSAIQVAVYTLLVHRIAKRAEQQTLENSATDDVSYLRKLRRLNTAYIFYGVVLAVTWVVIAVEKQYNIRTDFGLLLMPVCIIQLIGYNTIHHPVELQQILRNAVPVPRRRPVIDPERSRELATRLDTLMERSEPYLVEDLKLADLAELLQVPAHTLSQLINESTGSNFFDFVNRYRVERACELMRSPEYEQFTLVAIGEASGFASKASFNRAFKKHAGTTPSRYRSQGPVPDADRSHIDPPGAVPDVRAHPGQSTS